MFAGTGVKARSRGDHRMDVREDEERRRRSCGAAGRRLGAISSVTLKKKNVCN